MENIYDLTLSMPLLPTELVIRQSGSQCMCHRLSFSSGWILFFYNAGEHPLHLTGCTATLAYLLGLQKAVQKYSMYCGQDSLKKNFRKFEEIFFPVELQGKLFISTNENPSLAVRYWNGFFCHGCTCTSMSEAGRICVD